MDTAKITTMESKGNTSLATSNQKLIADLVLHGDISKMSEATKVQYYNSLCHSLNLNPVTKPFQILTFQGKTVLYATKDCTEQLRKINGVSVIEMIQDIQDGLIITKCKVQDKDGRYDIATGIVVMPQSPLERANAIMKSETKAKRRATLSICGLGILDESELDTMPAYETSDITAAKTNDNGNGKSTTGNPYQVLQNAKTIDELKKIWEANGSLHKDATFLGIKERRKKELSETVQTGVAETVNENHSESEDDATRTLESEEPNLYMLYSDQVAAAKTVKDLKSIQSEIDLNENLGQKDTEDLTKIIETKINRVGGKK